MELHYRRFKDLRSNSKTRKNDIQPYDSSRLQEKFKKEFLSKLTVIETQIQQTVDENKAIFEQNKIEQDFIDARKMKLEDRMIGLLSFNAVIMLYSRALETWKANAKEQLSDPIDDIGSLESQVAQEEAVVADLQKQLENDEFNQLEQSIINDNNSITKLEFNQQLLRNKLKFRKINLENSKKSIKKHSVEMLRDKSMKYHVNFDNLLIDETDYDHFVEKSDRVDFAKLQQKQEQLRKQQTEIAMSEEQYLAYFKTKTSEFKKKVSRLQELIEEIHEITDLSLQIESLSNENAKMSVCYAKMKDASSQEKREHAFWEYINAANNKRLEEIKQFDQKMEQMQAMLHRRQKRSEKRQANILDLQDEIELGLKRKEEYETEVLQLENKLFQLQLRLNLKLKECQADSDYKIPSELYTEKGKRIPRFEEMAKVLELVSIDKDNK